MKHIKNGCVNVGDTNMYYVSFGKGEKILVVLPGLSDGLATVKGKGRFLVSPYKKYLKDYTIYIFSRKNNMIPYLKFLMSYMLIVGFHLISSI